MTSMRWRRSSVTVTCYTLLNLLCFFSRIHTYVWPTEFFSPAKIHCRHHAYISRLSRSWGKGALEFINGLSASGRSSITIPPTDPAMTLGEKSFTTREILHYQGTWCCFLQGVGKHLKLHFWGASLPLGLPGTSSFKNTEKQKNKNKTTCLTVNFSGISIEHKTVMI